MECVDFILASVLDLVVENFAIALQVFSATGNTFEKLVTVRKWLELIDSSGILSDNSMDVIMLDIDFALKKLNAGTNQILQTTHNCFACEAPADCFKVISRCVGISVWEALAVKSNVEILMIRLDFLK